MSEVCINCENGTFIQLRKAWLMMSWLCELQNIWIYWSRTCGSILGKPTKDINSSCGISEKAKEIKMSRKCVSSGSSFGLISSWELPVIITSSGKTESASQRWTCTTWDWNATLRGRSHYSNSHTKSQEVFLLLESLPVWLNCLAVMTVVTFRGVWKKLSKQLTVQL